MSKLTNTKHPAYWKGNNSIAQTEVDIKIVIHVYRTFVVQTVDGVVKPTQYTDFELLNNEG